MKTILSLIMLIILPVSVSSSRYNYSYYGRVIHSAPGMTYATSFNAQTLGISLTSPEDFEIFNGFIYIVDSNENKLVVVNDNFEHVTSLSQFPLTQGYMEKLDQQGLPLNDLTLKSPFGIDVKESGIYIADTGNNRVVKLNFNFEVINTFSDLADPTFDELAFEPLKITVDPTERMYVVARNVYEGIIEINHDGAFNRFTGVNPIRMTPIEIFRRSLMTEAQLAQLKLYLPTEYTNVSINDRNFIYSTSKPSSNNAENMIQLINPKGVDVIKRNGYHPPMGDVHFMIGSNNFVITGPSMLVDIASTNHGIYTVLDQRRSRLFTYDGEGNLLYINGDEGAQSDRFSDGVALGYLGDDLLVLDRKSRTVIVYRLTEFGSAVNRAIMYHAEGEFDLAAEIWAEVIKLNTNYEIAYNGIGKYLLREGRFKEAMDFFKLGHDHYYYSKAFRGYRNEIIKQNFGYIVIGSVILGSGLIYLKIRKTYKKGGSILYEE
jgi:hypothetical protein